MKNMFNRVTENNLQKMIILFGLIYLFFVSRRGGDTRYIFSIILMVLSVFQYIIFKYNNFKNYKIEIILGIVYTILLTLVYMLSEYRYIDKNISIFFNMTLYSVIFLIICLNLKIDKNYFKYILPILMIFSLGSIFNGIKDVYENYKILSWYRIDGGSYTTVYALELGIYLILGIFYFFTSNKKYQKFLSVIYIFINLYLISCTKSRNDMIMLPLCFGLLAVIIYKKKGLLLFGMAVIIVLFSLKFSTEVPQLKRLSSISKIERIKKDARIEIFGKGLEVGKNNLVKGVGFNKYGRDGFNLKMYPNHPKVVSFHNIFIETFATQGIFVLISYICFLGLLFIRMIKNYYDEKDSLVKNIKLMGITVLIFSILYGMADTVFYMRKQYQLIFTIILLSLLVDNSRKVKDNGDR